MPNLLILSFGFILGTVFGSLIKALADRSLKGVSFFGRSYCDKCKKTLPPYDLFPILSFLLLKGRCRYCQDKLSLEYLLIEVLMGLLVAFLFVKNLPADSSFLYTLPSPKTVLALSKTLFETFITSVLIALFLTDLKKYLIPDRITYPAIIITFFYQLLFSLYSIYLIYQSLLNSVIGKYLLPPHSDYFYRHALIAASPFLVGLLSAILMAIFFGAIIFVTRGKGMGGGDLKLGVFLGLSFGFPNALLVLMIAFLTGSIVGVGLLITGRKKFKQAIPFGPFLSLGGLITLFWGEQILNWYLNIRPF